MIGHLLDMIEKHIKPKVTADEVKREIHYRRLKKTYHKDIEFF